MKKLNFKKIAVVLGASAALCGLVYQQNKINKLENENKPQAAKISSERIKVGTFYKLNGLSLQVSEYTYHGKKNYVVTTNLKQKEFYQVGSNDDKQGKTRGVTLAFGNDQK